MLPVGNLNNVLCHPVIELILIQSPPKVLWESCVPCITKASLGLQVKAVGFVDMNDAKNAIQDSWVYCVQ